MAAVAGAGSVDRLSGESVGPASASRWLARRTLYSLLVLALLTALALPLLQDSSMGRGPQARAGSVDLAAVSLSEKPVRLDGEWFAFLHGESGSAGTGSPVEVPGSWTNSQPEWPRQGRVTYRLDIRGLQQADHILHIPMLYAASAVRINGRPASTRGSPTESGDNLRYGLRAQYLPATPIAGRLRIEFRDGAGEFGPGQLVVVPRGVEHRTAADEEAEVLIFEPSEVINTGDAEVSEFTAPHGVTV